MEQKIKITNNASACIIDIEGVIGLSEESQFSTTSQSVATYERFREEVFKIKDIEAREVIVNIRSSGGDVNDALLIYEMLSSLNAKITTRCFGYTASAATIIAQAASQDCREIAASALYLIHQSSSSIEGNASDLAERIELLEKTDDRIATLYAIRSSREKSEFEKLMSENGGRGRWLTPEEVVEAGLADKITGVDEPSKPTKIIDRVKGWFSSTQQAESEKMNISDTNILHLPENSVATTSALALKAGQKSAKSTSTNTKEDPLLEEISASHNELAYAEDIRSLKFRGR